MKIKVFNALKSSQKLENIAKIEAAVVSLKDRG